MGKTFWIPTSLLAAALVLAAMIFGCASHDQQTAAPATTAQASLTPLQAQGKALADQYRCTGCHGQDLSGRPGRTPSLRESGVLQKYTEPKFEGVLATGATASGGQLKKMPVMNMPKAQADAIYAYLKTLS